MSTRNAYVERVGVCVVCGATVYASRKHTKTCSARCRKRLSRGVTNAPKGHGLIRINGVDYEAETGRMFTNV